VKLFAPIERRVHKLQAQFESGEGMKVGERNRTSSFRFRAVASNKNCSSTSPDGVVASSRVACAASVRK
jgi:hypothetical protein